jgi:prophage regulatory protein
MTSHSKLLRIKEVAQWLGVSQSAIYKWSAEGRFPAPIKLGGEDRKRVAARWMEEDIQKWIEEKRNAPNPE